MSTYGALIPKGQVKIILCSNLFSENWWLGPISIKNEPQSWIFKKSNKRLRFNWSEYFKAWFIFRPQTILLRLLEPFSKWVNTKSYFLSLETLNFSLLYFQKIKNYERDKWKRDLKTKWRLNMKLLAGLLVLSKAQGVPGGPGAIAIQVSSLLSPFRSPTEWLSQDSS